MNYIPNWIIDYLDKGKLECLQCKHPFSSKSISAVGIRDSLNQKSKHKEFLYVECFCKECNEVTIFELNAMGLVDLAFEILDDVDDETNPDEEMFNEEDIRDIEQTLSRLDEKLELLDEIDRESQSKIKNNNKKATCINKQEIQETKDFLYSSNCATHDDFLLAMGMRPEEIEDMYREGEKYD